MRPSLDETAPDNRDRPLDYYQGVNDGLRYAAEALESAHGFKDLPKPVIVVLALFQEALDQLDDHRMAWFMQHVGARMPTKKYVESVEAAAEGRY